MHVAYFLRDFLNQPNAALARKYLGIVPGGAVNFSAGTLSSTGTAITFANSNGVSFGLNALGVITASVAAGGGGLTNIKVSAGTLSQLRSDITFAAGNGVTFGLNAGGVVTASVQTNYQSPGAYLTTAMASDAGSNFLAATAGFFGTNASGTIASNGLSVSVDAPGISALKFSAGTLSSNRTDITFGDSNGVSWGLNTNGVITASFSAPPAASAVQQLNGSSGSLSIAAAGLNALSVNLSTITISARSESLNEIQDPTTDKAFGMGTNILALSWGVGGSISTNATRMGLFEIDFQGHLTQEGDLMHIHEHSPNPGTIDMLHIEGEGTDVTGLRLQMSASVGMEINMPIKFTTRDTNYAVGSVPFILNASMSNVVASLNADMVDGRHASQFAGLGFTTASTTGSDIVGTLSTNGLSMGVPKFLTTAAGGGALQSYWQNIQGQVNFGTNLVWTSNSSQVIPILLPYDMQLDYVRFWATLGSSANGTFATSNVNQTFSGAHFSTMYCVLYSLGTGASSQSLMSVTSFQTAMTQKFGVSEQSNQYTKGTSFSFPWRDSSSNIAVQQSFTTTNIAAGSTAAYGLSFFGNRWWDVPAGFSLPAGAYWLAVGWERASSSNVVSNLLQNSAPVSLLYLTQWNAGANNLGELGQAMNASGGGMLMLGLGLMITNVSGTLASFAVSDISTSGGYNLPFVQFIGTGIV